MPETGSSSLIYRVYSNHDGKVFLLAEASNSSVEVETPVSEKTLADARAQLSGRRNRSISKTLTAPQKQVDKQIRAAIAPASVGFLHFLLRLSGSFLIGAFAVFTAFLAIAIVNRGVGYSREQFPEKLHLVVLFIYAAGLAVCVYLMATEELRRVQNDRIKWWFGPYGMVFLPVMTLIVAASVFASFTFTLYNHQWVALQPCSGQAVLPGTLVDFYIWHFFKLVPFLKLNETLKWNEPLCYTQARVGLMILLFQALVVLPSINTIRYYWKNRRSLTGKNYEYVYEPGWKPEHVAK